MIASHEYWQEYYRVVGTLFATEEGLYRQLPADITSGFITLDVVYRLCTVDRAGRIRVQDFANKAARDKNDLLGGDVHLDGASWYTEAPGAGAFILDCFTVYSPLSSQDPNLFALAGYMHAQAKAGDQFGP